MNYRSTQGVGKDLLMRTSINKKEISFFQDKSILIRNSYKGSFLWCKIYIGSRCVIL